MNGEFIVGVDVGGTNIRIGAVDHDANLSGEKIFDSRKIQGGGAVEELLSLLKSYIASMQFPVRAVSIGFPSTLDKDRSSLINTPNLNGFDNVHIKALCNESLGMPVFINKDATMLLYYDLHKMGIEQDDIIAGIYIGTGIGNSIIVNGKEFTGSLGMACELGHIPVPGRDDPCSCGLKGCIELYAGGKGLERICAAEFPGTAIKEVFEKHGSTPQIKQFVEEAADAAAIEINILNPKYVVLGGGVLQMKSFPKERLHQIIMEKIRGSVSRNNTKIVFSDNANPFNGVVGSALYAMKQMQKETMAQ